MTIHTAVLQRTAPDVRSGPLTIPVVGSFDVEVRRRGEEAFVRVSSSDTVWEGHISYFPPQAYPDPSDGLWHGFMEFGHGQTWTYLMRGTVVRGEFHLAFDDDVKQPYRGPYFGTDETGRLVDAEGNLVP